MKVPIKAALVAVSSAALLWGCQQSKPANKAAPKPVTKAPEPAAKAAQPAREVDPITVPRVDPPVPPGGRRVVHLLFTSNVDGEVDPCG